MQIHSRHSCTYFCTYFLRTYWYVFTYIRICTYIGTFFCSYIKRILHVKCTYSQRMRTNVLLDVCRYDQSYVQLRILIRAATIRYMFPAVSANRDRPIYCIHSVKHYWAPALRPRRPSAPSLRSAPPPGERVGERTDCLRSFANVDVPPSNQRVACT